MPHRPRPGPAHHLERARRALVRSVGGEIERLRTDAGVTGAALARAAGVSSAQLSRVEAGLTTPSLPTLLAISAALGSDLSIRLYPNTGPAIHDRHQARILESLLRDLHPRWRATVEVPVRSPVRGVIDAVLHDFRGPVAVVTEIQSEIRRLEQQLRWHAEKAAALHSASLWPFLSHEGEPEISRLLVLRSTRATRELIGTFEATIAAAYPASTLAAVSALTDGEPWPGPSLVWAVVDARGARILDGPPRGVRLGR